MGAVFIGGDLMHFRENYDTTGAPLFNTERAQTLASLERAEKIVADAKATVIIRHDARHSAAHEHRRAMPRFRA